MRLKVFIILMCASFALVSNTRAGEATDPLAERLFPPDLILHNGEAIGLSDAKRQEILSRVEKAQTRLPELEEALRKEREAMVALLDREKPDETALLKQLNVVFAREQEIRREQFGLMLSLRSMLTAGQQARLNELRKTHNPSSVEARLKAKLASVEAGAQKFASNGGDPSSITEKMQQFPVLLHAGKMKEAEALLDRVLKELEAK